MTSFIEKYKRIIAVAVVLGLTAVASGVFMPTQAATSQCMATIVKQGSRGECARQAQEDLKRAGFNPGTIDGIFGNNSVAATKNFQASRKLTADGIIGPTTWSALNNSSSTPAPSTSGVGVGYNTKTGKESLVQTRLVYHRDVRNEPFYTGKIDGLFGVGSMNALIAFQRDRGLAVTSTVDVATWNALASSTQSHVRIGILETPKTGRAFVVSISQRTGWYVVDGKVIKSYKVRTAGWTNDASGKYRLHHTVIGSYTISKKDPNPSSPRYGEGAMPHSLIFHPDMYVHGSLNFQSTMYNASSHGCVNLLPNDAKELYGKMSVGDRVLIRA